MHLFLYSSNDKGYKTIQIDETYVFINPYFDEIYNL